MRSDGWEEKGERSWTEQPDVEQNTHRNWQDVQVARHKIDLWSSRRPLRPRAHSSKVKTQKKRGANQTKPASSRCQPALHHCHAAMLSSSAGSPTTRKQEAEGTWLRRVDGEKKGALHEDEHNLFCYHTESVTVLFFWSKNPQFPPCGGPSRAFPRRQQL